MSFPGSVLKPEIVHTAYTDQCVLMPSCTTSLQFTGKCARSVIQADKLGGFIGVVQKQYRQTKNKRGCLAKIRFIESQSENAVTIIAEGICRFQSDDYYFMKGYDFEQIVADYRPYEPDHSFQHALIEPEKINPIFLQYFISFLVNFNEENATLLIEGATMEKFINSLIMIIPVKDEERIFLSELASLDERQNALAFLLSVKEKSRLFNLPDTKN